MASWETAKKMCTSKGMELLTSSSDFEWHFIADVFAREISRPRNAKNDEEPVVVAFLNLYDVAVSVLF